MIDQLHRSERFRRDIACSTDKPWLRQQIGVHQYSATFCIGLAIVGALAFSGAFFACASI